MSRASTRFVAILAVVASASLGCWEQWSVEWFPQMKWQIAVQAFEAVHHEGQVEPFSPPEGTVPVSAPSAHIDPNDDAAANALVNPNPMTLASLENGRQRYVENCAPCHGEGGLGNGTVSMTGPLQGPLAAVLPIAGPASIARVRTDGHVYATIRYGRRRMPSYQRITSSDRWDIVNYVRYLNGQGNLVADQGGSQ